jgi:hypothetical protein
LLVARFTAPKMPSLKYSTPEEVSEATVLVSVQQVYEDVNYAVIAPGFCLPVQGRCSLPPHVDLPTMLVEHFVSGYYL